MLAISGPTVFPGYVVGRGENGHVLDGLGKLVDGWLDTGDLARVDADGFVHLAGRAKDLIIRGGHNIDPAVIEDALLAHPQVTAAAAVGRPDAARRRGPGRLRDPRRRRRRVGRGRAARLGGRAGRRAAPRHPRPSPCSTRCRSPRSASPYKLPLRADATRRELDAVPSTGSPSVRGVDDRGRGRLRRRPPSRSTRAAGEADRQRPSCDRYAGRTGTIHGEAMTRLRSSSPRLVAVVFVALGAAKILAAAPMRGRAAHAGFSVDAYRRIGVLEIAGAVGVLHRPGRCRCSAASPASGCCSCSPAPSSRTCATATGRASARRPSSAACSSPATSSP